mmetsp:Transcript_20912/g.57993  ORF Transcript_20912/g.57993 Transcript_20912/m.57993 type:complete len:283 (-) Transcript_20912:120-968(-)
MSRRCRRRRSGLTEGFTASPTRGTPSHRTDRRVAATSAAAELQAPAACGIQPANAPTSSVTQALPVSARRSMASMVLGKTPADGRQELLADMCASTGKILHAARRSASLCRANDVKRQLLVSRPQWLSLSAFSSTHSTPLSNPASLSSAARSAKPAWRVVAHSSTLSWARVNKAPCTANGRLRVSEGNICAKHVSLEGMPLPSCSLFWAHRRWAGAGTRATHLVGRHVGRKLELFPAEGKDPSPSPTAPEAVVIATSIMETPLQRLFRNSRRCYKSNKRAEA